MQPETVYLGLGANEGDRAANIHRAVERLASVPGLMVVRLSSLRESPLWGEGPEQGPYLNAVAELRSSLPPAALLAVCQAIERELLRRPAAVRNAPRPIDLDVLLHGERRIDDKDLTVPHPRMFERPFVTEPLRELGVDVDALQHRLGGATPRQIVGASEFASVCSEWLERGLRVGLVPTMGALHEGHCSLFERARRECDRVAATIFVNPLQFGPNEDLAAYPRDLPGDLRQCGRTGVDVVFTPHPADMYPAGFCSTVEVGAEAETMEGAVRPGHFRGVATVVARLFALARPHRAYFGQKDAQQVAVIRRMALDLGFPLQIVECPTVRDEHGLALSSRNAYLDDESRRAALVLSAALRAARAAFADGERDRDALLAVAQQTIAAEPRAELDYLELRREGDLGPLPAGPLPTGPLPGGRLLVAARFVGMRPVRLLDNMSLDAALEGT